MSNKDLTVGEDLYVLGTSTIDSSLTVLGSTFLEDDFFIENPNDNLNTFTVDSSTGNTYIRGNLGVNKLSAGEKIDVDGNVQANQFKSTVAEGTAPLTVNSTTRVNNLNADKVDGADVQKTSNDGYAGMDDSDESIPTTKVVADFAPPKRLSILNNRTYTSSKPTAVKDNSFMYVWNEQDSGVMEKVSVSKIHRSSGYLMETEQSIIDSNEILPGDFLYVKNVE